MKRALAQTQPNWTQMSRIWHLDPKRHLAPVQAKRPIMGRDSIASHANSSLGDFSFGDVTYVATLRSRSSRL